MKKPMASLWLLLLAAAVLLCVPAVATEDVDPQPHSHNVESWTAVEGGHSGVCTDCSETVTQGHTMDEGVVTTAPTCQADGKKTFTCSACGATEEETIPKLTDHVCNDWTVGETQHTGECIHCSEALARDHTYGEGVVTQEPTCKTEGIKTFTCSVCGHTKTETLPTTAHSMDEGVVTTAPTCQADGKKTFTCSACGATEEETIPKLDDHVGGNWSSDDTGHTGTCIHCGAEIVGEHIHDQKTVTLEPTCQAEGKQTVACICGHSYEETVPKLDDHVGGNWSSDETGHTGTCIHCGAEVTGEHRYDEGTVTLEPTCTTDGSKTLTCTDCGHTKQEVITSPGHAYGDWVSTGDTYHKHSCACGDTAQEKHTWNKGVITRYPTCDKFGIKTYTCTGCGQTKNVQTYIAGHTYSNSCDITCNVCGHIRRPTHNWGTKWYSDETTHWHECTVCHAVDEQLAHTASDWIVDVPPGEYTEGKKHTECTVCARVLETTAIPATGCLHGNEELRGAKDPTCTEEGYTGDWTCPRCEEVVTAGEAIPMLPHQTQLQNAKEPTCTEEGYTGDHICQVCQTTVTEGQPIDMLPHQTQLQNAKEATCTEEGYTGDHICQNCQTTVTEGQPIDMLPHQTQLQNAKEATCTEEGYTGDHVCQNCQTTVTEGQPIEKLSHNIELQGAVQHTCTADGYTGDFICTNCNQIIEAGRTVPTEGHIFVNGSCAACGATDPNYVPPTTPNVDIDTDPEPKPMSPVIIAAIAMLAFTGIGLVVLIILMIKKK